MPSLSIGPDDTRLVDVNLVGRRRDVIAARRADLVHDHVQRLVRIALLETLDFIDDDAGLHGAAAGAVNAQDDGRRARIGKGLVQRRDDGIGRAAAFVFDGAVDFDQRRVAAQRLDVGTAEVEVEICPDREECEQKKG
jgi:hypothetical protein